MDHGTSCEIKDGECLIEESTSPDPVCHGCIDEYRPQCHEYGDRVEPYPLDTCTKYDTCCDKCEHHLEYHELHIGDRAPFGDGVITHTVEEEFVKVTNDTAEITAECE